MRKLLILPEVPEKLMTEIVERALDDPSLATVLRKLFQEIEHLAYREQAIQEREKREKAECQAKWMISSTN